MSEGRPPLVFIADGIEASLALGWYLIFGVGVLLAVFVSPIFYVAVVVGVVADWLLLRHRVARRLGLGRDERKMLWLWTSQRGVYHALRYLAGRK